VSKVSSFLLSKWYLDCLDPNGNGTIVYAAELRWKTLRMRYASTLILAGGKVEIASSIRNCPLPERSDGKIVLRLPHLGVAGVWEGFAPPVEHVIFEDNSGSVLWNCLQPAARVELSLRGRTSSGLGYAELLQISVPPWRLPLDELHWGRFISESDSLVWIDWRGSYSRRLLLHNAKETEVDSITEEEVRGAGGQLCLSLDRGLVLRSGKLGKTVFPSIRRLARAIPLSMLQVHETKWRSHGALRLGGNSASGWAIHEIVRWKKE